MSDVEKSNFPPLFTYQSISNLVINIAVNNDATIPINKVVANPLIGPVPNTNKIKAVKPVGVRKNSHSGCAERVWRFRRHSYNGRRDRGTAGHGDCG